MGDTNQITVIAVSGEFLREKAFITAHNIPKSVGRGPQVVTFKGTSTTYTTKEGIEIILIWFFSNVIEEFAVATAGTNQEIINGCFYLWNLIWKRVFFLQAMEQYFSMFSTSHTNFGLVCCWNKTNDSSACFATQQSWIDFARVSPLAPLHCICKRFHFS